MSVAIGYIHPEFVRAEFANSLVRTQRLAQTPIERFISLESGPLIASARNDVCSMFLAESRADWLLMIDTDMAWEPEAFDKLVQTAVERHLLILGALCFTKLKDGSGDYQSTAYDIVVENGQPRFKPYQELPENDVFPVQATGAAFLLAHRDALTRVASGWGNDRDTLWPWFRESSLQGRRVGEDLTFCMRARSAGIPIYVHTGVQVGHIKSQMLGKSVVL